MAKAGFKPSAKRDPGRWKWFNTCHPELASDSEIRTGLRGKWSDGKRSVSQVLVVYRSDPTAVVANAEEKVDCTTYLGGDGRKVTGVKAMTLPKLPGAKASFAWCQDISRRSPSATAWSWSETSS